MRDTEGISLPLCRERGYREFGNMPLCRERCYREDGKPPSLPEGGEGREAVRCRDKALIIPRRNYFVLCLMRVRTRNNITTPKIRDTTALLVKPATRNVKNDTAAAVMA